MEKNLRAQICGPEVFIAGIRAVFCKIVIYFPISSYAIDYCKKAN